jgi:hypothetical protein
MVLDPQLSRCGVETQMGPSSDIMPPNVTACVGGANFRRAMYYVLLKNDRLLVVEAPSCYIDNVFEIDWRYHTFLNEKYDSGMVIIQSLLDDVEFSWNWAYLVENKKGDHCLIYKNKPIRISCTPFARSIPESEIKITKWISAEERHGIWNGREVDLLMAWDDLVYAKKVEKFTNGYRAIQGLDLSFEVIGHVVRDDRIIGIMTEPAYGRMIEHGDQALVYEAVAKLQQHGVLYASAQHAPFIMISEGKVRFLDIDNMTPLPEAELIQQAKMWWEWLDKSFRELRAVRNIYTPSRYVPQRIKVFPRIPSPPRPSFHSNVIIAFELLYRKFYGCPSDGTVIKRRRQHRTPRKRRTICLAPDDSLQQLPEDGETDMPLATVLHCSRSRGSRSAAIPHLFHPYGRTTRTKPLLPWSEESDTSSVVEVSD